MNTDIIQLLAEYPHDSINIDISNKNIYGILDLENYVLIIRLQN